ncbi:MAG: UDP-N-acetylmuramate dehydrogenase [Candidatus Dojkabacteria bacterium]
MKIHENASLKPHNTLYIDVKAKYLVEIETEQDLVDFVKDERFTNMPHVILGRGSNTLFANDCDGVVLKIEIKGRNIIKETDKYVLVELGAGEDWPEFVEWAVAKGWSGVENLAYIPGTLGAAPVQNIAAYGQTLDEIFVKLEAVDLRTGNVKSFLKRDCGFEYRRSFFKTDEGRHFVITSVRLRLSKKPHFDTYYHGRFSYESLQKWLDESGAKAPYTPKMIANAITQMRKFKLPDVADYGTCGSFFLNPFVTVDKFRELEKQISELQHYPITKMEYDRIDWHNTGQDQVVKIPAGRVLDELGWKGKWVGNVGTFERHALCVITNKKASGHEVIDYLGEMKKSVKAKYGIELESEVRIVK